MLEYLSERKDRIWLLLLGAGLGVLATLSFRGISLYFIPGLLEVVDKYCEAPDHICESLKVAAEIGRLDLLTTILGLVGAFALGFFFFSLGELKSESKKAAKEEARKLGEALVNETQKIAEATARRHSQKASKKAIKESLDSLISLLIGDENTKDLRVGVIDKKIDQAIGSQWFEAHITNIVRKNKLEILSEVGKPAEVQKCDEQELSTDEAISTDEEEEL